MTKKLLKIVAPVALAAGLTTTVGATAAFGSTNHHHHHAGTHHTATGSEKHRNKGGSNKA